MTSFYGGWWKPAEPGALTPRPEPLEIVSEFQVLRFGAGQGMVPYVGMTTFPSGEDAKSQMAALRFTQVRELRDWLTQWLDHVGEVAAPGEEHQADG